MITTDYKSSQGCTPEDAQTPIGLTEPQCTNLILDLPRCEPHREHPESADEQVVQERDYYTGASYCLGQKIVIGPWVSYGFYPREEAP